MYEVIWMYDRGTTWLPLRVIEDNTPPTGSCYCRSSDTPANEAATYRPLSFKDRGQMCGRTRLSGNWRLLFEGALARQHGGRFPKRLACGKLGGGRTRAEAGRRNTGWNRWRTTSKLFGPRAAQQATTKTNVRTRHHPAANSFEEK